MLKRLFLLIIVLILSLFVTKTSIYSQEPPIELSRPTFDEVYAEYVNSIDEYNLAHDEFLLRRSQHLKFQSQKSRQNAFDATLIMLEKRDNVVISYLEVLKIKLREGIGISDVRMDGLLLKIDDENEWFTDHRDNLSTTGSLDDLVSDSKVAKLRWVGIEPLAYEVMSALSSGKITKFDERLDEIFSDVKDKLELIRNDEREEYSFSSSKLQILDRWVFEADGRIVRSKEKQSEAEELFVDITKVKKDAPTNYNYIIEKLTESQLYMNEATSFLEEIIDQIKIEER